LLFTVAFTSTVPTACAGDTRVHSVVEVQLTDLLTVVPNLTFVAVLPRAKPVPVMVTLVPPALDPVFGLTLVTVGTNRKRSFDETALVPPEVVVTVTSTLPSVSAGETAVIEVADLTVKLAALVEPKLTAVVPVRFFPVMVTAVPPTTEPFVGETFPTTGGGT